MDLRSLPWCMTGSGGVILHTASQHSGKRGSCQHQALSLLAGNRDLENAGRCFFFQWQLKIGQHGPKRMLKRTMSI